MQRIRPTVLLALAASAVLATACGTADDTPAPSSAAVSATTTDTATTGSATTHAPTPTVADPTTVAASANAGLTVTDIRIGTHDGFDRVVYEMGGEGVPGFRVGYTDDPAQQGSGRPVTTGGAATLQVLIDGAAMPFDSGVEQYSGPDPVEGAPGGSVVAVTGAGVFEGVAQSFIGVSRPDAAFSVDVLSEPTRLVIDIAH